MNAQAVRRPAVIAVAIVWTLWVASHAFRVPEQPALALIDHPIAALHEWREALWRAARGAAGAGLVLLAAWQVGRVCLRRVSFDSGLDALLFTLAVGVVVLDSTLLFVAQAGVYRPGVVAGLVLLAAAARPAGLWHDSTRLAGRLRRAWAMAGRSGGDRVFIAVAVVALAYAAVAALAPETEYDALWYHLWLPQEWLAHGRLTDPPGEYIGLYPGGWELLNGAAMALGGPVAARLLHWACLPLCALAACAVARWSAPAVSAPLIVSLVVTPPTVLWEASTAYVDLALAWMVTLVVVAVARRAAGGAQTWLWLGVVAAGGALGIKHLGLVAVAIAAGTLFAAELRQRTPYAAAGVAAVFLAGALALAMPWYGRAYAASGNPVFPELYSLFGAVPATRWSPETQDALRRFAAHFGFGRAPGALLLLPWNLTVHAAAFGGTFGPLLLILLPFGVAGRHAWRRAALLAAVAAYVAVWASPLGSFQLRFLVPLVPVLGVMAATGASALGAAAGRCGAAGRQGVVAVVTLLLVCTLPPFIEWHEADRRGWNGWLTHVHRGLPLAVVLGAESERDYLTRKVPTYGAWQYIGAATPPDSVVLTFLSGDQFYGTRARLWSDATLATDVTWGVLAGDEPRMLAAAGRHGLTHVLFAREQLRDDEFRRLAIASQRTRECCLELVYEDPHVVLYRLTGSSVAGESGSARR